MQATQRKPTAQFIQHPPLPPNTKSHVNLLAPRQPYLARTNSNSKSLKKLSAEKSSKQKQFEQELKYALPIKIQTSLDRSAMRSQNNVDELLIHNQRQLQDSSGSIARKQPKKDNMDYTVGDKFNSTKPFDALSGISGSYEQKTKADQYYLYWKAKAHDYLESNMKFMEEIRNLTRQNVDLKQRLQIMQASANSIIKKQEANSLELIKQSSKKQENRTNVYIVQKMQYMQRELKKKDIVVKTYEEKIIQLNARIVADNQRSKLINKLKSEIDGLKAQLHGTQTIKNGYITAYNSVIQDRFRNISKKGENKGSICEKK